MGFAPVQRVVLVNNAHGHEVLKVDLLLQVLLNAGVTLAGIEADVLLLNVFVELVLNVGRI